MVHIKLKYNHCNERNQKRVLMKLYKYLVHMLYDNFSTGKLLARTQKIAYNMLQKTGHKGEGGIKPNDRVCLILYVL